MAVCTNCDDSHMMYLDGGRPVPCTACPSPCDQCRAGGIGAYCSQTPCGCACHQPKRTVDHPQHYRPGPYEAINVIEAWKLGFNLGNAVKYIARHDLKGSAVEDLKKARWYLDREIANREAGR